MVKKHQKEDDKRFQKTEKSLRTSLKAIFKDNEANIQVKTRDVYNRANTKSSTFYRHYHSANDILTTSETKLKSKFQALIPKFSGQSTKEIWQQILVFLCRNREVMEYSLMRDDITLLDELLDDARQPILESLTLTTSDPKHLEIIWALYKGGAIGLIEFWYDCEACDIESVNRILHHILRFGRTLRAY